MFSSFWISFKNSFFELRNSEYKRVLTFAFIKMFLVIFLLKLVIWLKVLFAESILFCFSYSWPFIYKSLALLSLSFVFLWASSRVFKASFVLLSFKYAIDKTELAFATISELFFLFCKSSCNNSTATNSCSKRILDFAFQITDCFQYWLSIFNL